MKESYDLLRDEKQKGNKDDKAETAVNQYLRNIRKQTQQLSRNSVDEDTRLMNAVLSDNYTEILSSY